MRLAIIAGTGIAERLINELHADEAHPHAIDTPFGPTSDPILTTTLRPPNADPIDVALLARHGNAHQHPPHNVPYRANIFALKTLGVTHIAATGACGSLRDHITPSDVALPDQIIDRTIHRPRTFYDDLAVHAELADPMCPVMRAWLTAAAETAGIRAHTSATYVCMEGPAFSTRAESEMHRAMGGDLIGMTAQPEARLAREAEIAYALIALPTDFDCWKPRDTNANADHLLQEIIGNLTRAGDAAFALLRAAMDNTAALHDTPSPAHTALDNAVWTARDAINPETLERLKPLLARALS